MDMSNTGVEKLRKNAAPRPAGNRGQGRKPGVPNKHTAEMREFWKNIVEGQQSTIAAKLSELADTDAAKYLSTILHAQEFFAPRLNRTEMTGADGGPVQVQSVRIELVEPKRS